MCLQNVDKGEIFSFVYVKFSRTIFLWRNQSTMERLLVTQQNQSEARIGDYEDTIEDTILQAKWPCSSEQFCFRNCVEKCASQNNLRKCCIRSS